MILTLGAAGAPVLAMIAIAAMAADRPADVPGWSDTRWGMTDKQVLAVIPEAAPLATKPNYASFVVNIGIKRLDVSREIGRASCRERVSERV
jgi:hypothetical protein